MDMESSPIQMVGDMKDILKTIKNMDMEHFTGQMVENMWANGNLVCNMAKESTPIQVDSLNKATGNKVKDKVGYTNKN